METQSIIRLRLVFEDRSLLSETQRSDGINQSWLLIEPNQHPKISDVCNHLLHIFDLRDLCPNGILLYMDGFVLPMSESTRILKDKEILGVKRKELALAEAIEGADAGAEVNRKEPVDNGKLLLLANKELDQETGEYDSESEEENLEDESSPVGSTVSKKRKLSTKLQSLEKKKHRSVRDGDDEEVATEDINVNDDECCPMKTISKKIKPNNEKGNVETDMLEVKSPPKAKRVSGAGGEVVSSLRQTDLLSASSDASSENMYSASSSRSSSNTHLRNIHVLSKNVKVSRDREASHDRLVKDYFAENPVYGGEMFKKRFKMRRKLFVRIVDDMDKQCPHFRLSWDVNGKRGFSPLQKCTSSILQLVDGTISHEHNKYLNMSERTSSESLQSFCTSIIQLYGHEYLRKPTTNDTKLLYAAHESKHGFIGMLGSIDGIHWAWKNCPTTWRSQYMKGDQGHPTIQLEAVASQDLWIWHAHFSVSGSNNINVLNPSPIFNNVYCGTAPKCPFQVDGVHYTHGYYLGSEMCPPWAAFVITYKNPNGEKRERFNTAQELARKDVKRAFRALKSRWGIFRNLPQAMHHSEIRNIMYACIILHNMILKDEGLAICPFLKSDLPTDDKVLPVHPEYIRQFSCQETHYNLREDLVHHLAKTYIPNLNC